MKYFFLTAGLLLSSVFSFSQKTVDVNREPANGAGAINHFYTVAGQPYATAKFIKVTEGSAFFNDSFMYGAIILSEGREYKKYFIRLNLLESQVNYIDERQVEMTASTPLREVVLWDTLLKKDYRFVHADFMEAKKKPEKGFYELLQGGRAELYRQHKKSMVESQPYGNATYEQKILTELRYFILAGGQWKRVRKIQELTAALADKRKELEQYITTQKLQGDNPENFETLVKYYNGLFNQ